MIPDPRCNGGHHQIKTLMTNHYAALQNVKPSINTREKPFTKTRPRTAKTLTYSS